MNISLTKTLKQYVHRKVGTGDYESASEVVRESLRLSQFMEEQRLFWADVRDKVASARKQVENGEYVDGPAAMDEIIAELDKPPAARKPKKRRR